MTILLAEIYWTGIVAGLLGEVCTGVGCGHHKGEVGKRAGTVRGCILKRTNCELRYISMAPQDIEGRQPPGPALPNPGVGLSGTVRVLPPGRKWG